VGDGNKIFYHVILYNVCHGCLQDEPALRIQTVLGNCLKCGIICELLNALSAVEMRRDSALFTFSD